MSGKTFSILNLILVLKVQSYVQSSDLEQTFKIFRTQEARSTPKCFANPNMILQSNFVLET